MIRYNDLLKIVRDNLSENRFKHSLGVVDRAIMYGKIYDVDLDVIKLVAISHDIAKEFSKDCIDMYINKYKIKLDEIEKNNSNLVHAKVGAHICKYEYGFSSDMVNAVMYHTTGRANMSMLEKIIYLADATEKGRNYNDINWYVDVIKDNINRGMVEVSKWVIEDLLKKKRQIHNDTIGCYNYYLNNIDLCKK